MNSSPATASQTSPRKRFRASEIPEHLDVNMMAQVCLGVSLKGYCQLLSDVFAMKSGSFPKLLKALDTANTQELNEVGHAFKGETASLGLQSLAQQALICEKNGAEFTPEQCNSAAMQLRETWDTVRALCLRMGYLTA
jgi:hypothetical protein